MNSIEERYLHYPTTRYSGSKRRFLDWIWSNVKDLKFESVLDAFGGTASVSLMFKVHAKQVIYNDLLKFNQIIGMAIIENSKVTVKESDLEAVLRFSEKYYPNFIQAEFKDIFFLDEENAWLDKVVNNIARVKNCYKRSILMASLFQACLAKRPFNLFHRANLYLRTNSVKRSFGNKTTWERPFPELLQRFVSQYNKAIFSNGRKNMVIGGYSALSAPNGVDLVYLDPPYFSRDRLGTNYLEFYHFLEGLANYKRWPKMIGGSSGKIRKIADSRAIEQFTKRSEIVSSLFKLIERYQHNIIVLSYQSEGVPSQYEIVRMFKNIGKRVKVFKKMHKYALSTKTKAELLFVAE